MNRRTIKDLDQLSTDQQRILRWMLRGENGNEIAARMRTNVSNIRNAQQIIYKFYDTYTHPKLLAKLLK